MTVRIPATHRVSVALAILQPYLLSWVAVVVLALLNYVLTAGSPLLGDTSWQDAAKAGGSLWLLALGVPTLVGTGSVGLPPLVLTAAILAATVAFLRKIKIVDGWDLAVAAGAGGATALLIRAWSLPATSTLGAIVGGAVLGLVGGAFARRNWRTPDRFAWLLREGWRIAQPAFFALVVIGTLMFILAIVAGWSRISAIHSAYLTGAAGTAFFIVLELLFLPAAPVWALAFISGAGFAVGAGTHFSALGSVSAPLPAIPLLGAIPSPASHMPWMVAILVVTGIAWGVLEARRGIRLRDTWAPLTAAMLLLGLSAAVSALLASGGIGTGRMATIGVRPPIFAGVILLETAVPLLLVLGVQEFLDYRSANKAAASARAADPSSAESETAQSEQPQVERAKARPAQDEFSEEGAVRQEPADGAAAADQQHSDGELSNGDATESGE